MAGILPGPADGSSIGGSIVRVNRRSLAAHSGAHSVIIGRPSCSQTAARAAIGEDTHEESRLGCAEHREDRPQRVLPGMRKSGLWRFVRSHRATGPAREAADPLGIPKAYGSYEALLADPEIEAIYNPLPNHLHVPLTLQAAAAGKHVLCEKPIALTAQEATQLRAAAGKVLITEAFMVRFHPQWLRARELVRQGRIGTLRAVQMFFGYNNVDPANIRNKADIGGGGLYDIGCYAIMAGRFFSRPNRSAASRSSTATPSSAPIGSPARWWISATAAISISRCRRRSRLTSACSCAAPRAGSRSRSRSTRRKARRPASPSTMARRSPARAS